MTRHPAFALIVLLLIAATACKSPPGRSAEKEHEPPAANEVLGTEGDDNFPGTPGDDVIGGEGGNDQVSGSDGNDELRGGEGDDLLHGGPGNDKMNGGPGSDTLNGGDGNDFLLAGEGNDQVNAGDGDDEVYAGEGDDLASGSPGDDVLFGNDGNDVLVGSEGADKMEGNEGADTFLYRAGHADGKMDTISDFNPGEGDRLDLSELLARDKYAGDGSAASLAGYLRVQGTVIEYDSSGSGKTFVPLADIKRSVTIEELVKGKNVIALPQKP
ncbi:MAG: calcium-binding protein [Bdellovibrionota bacterium]